MVTWWTSQRLGPEDTGDERIISVSGYRLHSWSLWVCHVMKERLARWTNHVCRSEPIGQVPESYKGFVHSKRIVHDWHTTSRRWIECSRLCHRIQFQTQTLCINCISVLLITHRWSHSLITLFYSFLVLLNSPKSLKFHTHFLFFIFSKKWFCSGSRCIRSSTDSQYSL